MSLWRWAGVRKEYDDSSLMYKYVTEDESRWGEMNMNSSNLIQLQARTCCNWSSQFRSECWGKASLPNLLESLHLANLINYMTITCHFFGSLMTNTRRDKQYTKRLTRQAYTREMKRKMLTSRYTPIEVLHILWAMLIKIHHTSHSEGTGLGNCSNSDRHSRPEEKVSQPSLLLLCSSLSTLNVLNINMVGPWGHHVHLVLLWLATLKSRVQAEYLDLQYNRTIELVMFVFAKPAAPTPEQSFLIFKEAAEAVKDIEELLGMHFADFETAAKEGKRVPAVVRLKTKPWAGKRLRGRLEVNWKMKMCSFEKENKFSCQLNKVSSRDSLWRRVVEMGKGSVDLVNALTGKDLPQAFKAAGLNESSV